MATAMNTNENSNDAMSGIQENGASPFMSDVASAEYSSLGPTDSNTGEMYISGVITLGKNHMAKKVTMGMAITPATESKKVPDIKVSVSQKNMDTASITTPAKKFSGSGQPSVPNTPSVI